MRKFKLLLKYPGSPEVGSIFTEQSNGNYAKESFWINKSEIINYPHLWEEIKSDYEILSFYAKNIGGSKNYPYGVHPDYIWKETLEGNGRWSRGGAKRITTPMTTSEILNHSHYGIHSVKRLVDGHIFTIGDRVDVNEMSFNIKGFTDTEWGLNLDGHSLYTMHYLKYAKNVVKPAWEIHSFRSKDNYSTIYSVQESGKYYAKGTLMEKEVPLEQFLLRVDYEIFSVRRTKDGEVFTIGDKVKTTLYSELVREILSFTYDNSLLHNVSVQFKNVKDYSHSTTNVNNLEKKVSVIFTTEDGLDYYDQSIQLWYVKDDMKVTEVYGPNYWNVEGICTKKVDARTIGTIKPKYKWFSTEHAALTYVLKNYQCLTINDIITRQGSNMFPVYAVQSLEEMVRQRYKQAMKK